ncbi:hypothetical protein HYDPIDRAFT_76224, partial [Hydnomerulius pinastri MD-312]
SIKWTRAQLFGGKLSHQRRAPNAWNAYVRKQLQESNKERPAGQKYKLPQFIAQFCSEITRGYCNLTEEEKACLVKELACQRQGKVSTIRTSPKSLQKLVNAAFSGMEKEVSITSRHCTWASLNSRTAVEGFYIAVRSDVEHFHEAKIFCSPKAATFIKDVLKYEPKHLALKLESWVSAATTNQRLPLTKLVSLCHCNIQDGLDVVLKSNNTVVKQVQMNYGNYERKIVEKYGVGLAG